MEITTLRTAANQCPDIVNCPAVDVIDARPDRVYFIGNVETDPRILDAYAGRVGPGEAVFWQPAELHPEITA